MIGKYEFDNYDDFLLAKDSLEKYEDEFIYTHTIVEIGVINGKYCVDVCWAKDLEEEPVLFKNKKIDLDNEGVHSFYGLEYVENKI